MTTFLLELSSHVKLSTSLSMEVASKFIIGMCWYDHHSDDSKWWTHAYNQVIWIEREVIGSIMSGDQ